MGFKELNEFQRNASFFFRNKCHDGKGSCMSLDEKKEELFRLVMAKCYNRPAPIEFCFEGYLKTNGGHCECPFQPFEDIYNYGDDDTPDEKSDAVYRDTGSIDGDYYDNDYHFGLDDYGIGDY